MHTRYTYTKHHHHHQYHHHHHHHHHHHRYYYIARSYQAPLLVCLITHYKTLLLLF